MRTYTLLDWDAEHADRLSVNDWYSGQFDPLETAIKALPKVEADAIWCDAMLFLVADWVKNRDSEVPLILRDHLDVPPASPDDDFGPIIGLRLANRQNRSDVITVLADFWNKPAQTRAACYVKADVAAAMTAEWNLTKEILLLAVQDLTASMKLLRKTEPQTDAISIPVEDGILGASLEFRV